MTIARRSGCAAFGAFALVAATLAFAQPGRNPYDIPFPPKSPPYKFLNEHGQEVECTVTPWQLVDLGTVAGMRIYAGDHCSMPSNDAISKNYKQVFSNSCDLHDICYFAPGNTKKWCDDMVKWHWDRDCQRAYSTTASRDLCHVAATAWRTGLDTPISDEYWKRSQDWGRRNCHINPPPAITAFSWVAYHGGTLPDNAVNAAAAGEAQSTVCRVSYQNGVHAGRVAGSNCEIGYGGRDWGIGGGEVLVAQQGRTQWVSVPVGGPMPPQAVVAGIAAGMPMVVCRARHDASTDAGKVVNGYCNVGYGGKELTVRPFDVLVFR